MSDVRSRRARIARSPSTLPQGLRERSKHCRRFAGPLRRNGPLMSAAEVMAPAGHAPCSATRCRCGVSAGTAASSARPTPRCACTWCAARALRRMLWAPNELGFARAYVSGDLDIEGDLWAGLEALDAGRRTRAPGPGCTVDAATKRRWPRAVAAARRRSVRRPHRRPRRRSCAGRRHSKRRDADAIAHHYDVGNDFYRVLLGRVDDLLVRLLAGPGHRRRLDGRAGRASATSSPASSGCAPGMRVLDVGCGWGTFALHAARAYGAQVVGVTLSERAGRLRPRADRRGRRRRPRRDPRPGLPRRRRRALRRDRQHRDGRTRRLRRCCRATPRDLFALLRAGGPAAQPRDLAPSRPRADVLQDLLHRPLRVPRRRTACRWRR